jgi:hypothetical protein
MRPPLVVVSSLTVVAGVGSGALPDDRLGDTYTGSVTGIVVLPSSAVASSACASLDVYVTADDGKGDASVRIGRRAVHRGEGRCSYEITHLPSSISLDVHVDAPRSLICGNTSSLIFATDSDRPFLLRDGEDRTEDFHAQCSAGRSSL